MRSQIAEMIRQNPSVLIGAGKKKRATKSKKGGAVVDSYSNLIASGVTGGAKKNMKGGFGFLAPLLASALAPVAGQLFGKILGNGVTGGSKKMKGGFAWMLPILASALAPIAGKLVSKVIGSGRTGGGRSGAGRTGGAVVDMYSNLIASGKPKKKVGAYQSLVKKVCKEQGCTAPKAAAYIKKNKLY